MCKYAWLWAHLLILRFCHKRRQTKTWGAGKRVNIHGISMTAQVDLESAQVDSDTAQVDPTSAHKNYNFFRGFDLTNPH